MREEKAITRQSGSPFARMNWDSPASVSALTSHGPVKRANSGVVVLFGCGCASWATYQDPADVNIPDWDGATVVPYVRIGGQMCDPDGRLLPSYMDCVHGNDDGWQT